METPVATQVIFRAAGVIPLQQTLKFPSLPPLRSQPHLSAPAPHR